MCFFIKVDGSELMIKIKKTLSPLRCRNINNNNKSPFRYPAMPNANPSASDLGPANRKWNDSARTSVANGNYKVDSHTFILREK